MLTSPVQNLFSIPTAMAQRAAETANNPATPTITDKISEFISNLAVMIPLFFLGFIIIVLSFIIAKIVKNSVENKMSEQGFEEEHREIQIVAGRTANAAVLILGSTVGLKVAGLDLTPIIAAGAFGAGFALQDLITNFLAGIMILVAKHYTIGDVIAVNGKIGRIQSIQTRATIIKALDGTKVIVPNKELFNSTVISKTGNLTRRLKFIMGCGYDDDLKEVARLTLEVLKTIDGILPKPKPKVIFYEWGDFEVLFKILVWIDSKGGKLVKVKNDVIIKLTEAYNNANFEMPYPIQSVELTSLYSPPARIETYRRKTPHPTGPASYPSRFHANQQIKQNLFDNNDIEQNEIEQADLNYIQQNSASASVPLQNQILPNTLEAIQQIPLEQQQNQSQFTPPISPNQFQQSTQPQIQTFENSIYPPNQTNVEQPQQFPPNLPPQV